MSTVELHYKDLFADIIEHPNSVVGAWIKILCTIWDKGVDGTVTRSIFQWSRIIGECEETTNNIINYLSEESIADVDRGEIKVSITSRRARRDSGSPATPTPLIPPRPTTPAQQYTLQQCKDVGFSIGMTEEQSENAHTHWSMQGWLRKNGMQITNLTSAMTYWRAHQHEFEVKKGDVKSKVKGAMRYQ